MSVPLHHRVEGPLDAPVVMLAPSLGTTTVMWDDLTQDLARDHRVVRFDHRGHGGSPAPDGPYSVEDLAADVVALAGSLGIEQFGFVGISMGGAVGQVLALDHADRVSCLVLCSTGPRFADPQTWRDRAALVRSEGMEPLTGPTRERWFTEDFRRSHPEDVERLVEMLTATVAEGYAGCCDALASYDVTDRLDAISAPTRVVAGSEDPVSGPAVAQILVDGIPDADLVVLDGVSHMAQAAAPERFSAAVRAHLDRCR